MHLFYNTELNNDIIELSPQESRHCAKVLRLKPGDEVAFTDGNGMRCFAKLVSTGFGLATASVFRREIISPRPFQLHMAVAPTKNIDRYEWFIEKATECGVDEITPIVCAQSERTVVKHERLEKIMVAAMKQSQRAYLPKLNDAIKLDQFIKQDFQGQSFIAHCDQKEGISLKVAYTPGQSATILIGPEGDFSTQEIKQALVSGFRAISLGNNRLRTETAALVSCVEVNFLNGEI
jgi:16S rRNA (uracil1498-N3)-methyltransferase